MDATYNISLNNGEHLKLETIGKEYGVRMTYIDDDWQVVREVWLDRKVLDDLQAALVALRQVLSHD